MSSGSTPSSTRRRRQLLVVLATAAALLWWVQPPSNQGHSAHGTEPNARTSAAQDRSTRPRRVLPTRTEADRPPEPEGPPMVCPLVAIDADTSALIEDPAAVLPSHLEVELTPPVVPRLTIALDDSSGQIPEASAARLRHLPLADGVIYGEDPEVGLVALTFDQGECVRLQVLVVGEPPPDAVTCALDDALTLLDIRRVLHASGPHTGRSIRVRPWRGSLVLEGVPESGDGWVQLADGHPPLPFSWDASGCDEIATVGTATLTVRITNPPPRGPSWVRGCGVSEYLPPGTSELELEIPATPCAIEAWRTDGALRALSPLATVDLDPGEHARVALTLPEDQVAGLGIQFQPGEAGVSVTAVWPDSPAWAAGLRAGDRIVAVDDEPVGGLQDSDFIALGTGPVGSTAVLEVERADGSLDVLELERAPLSGSIN